MTEIVVRFTVPTEHTETLFPVITQIVESISPVMPQIDGAVEVLVDGQPVREVL